jgi:tetratricopeptide (TPR) repeat protein
VAPGGAASPVHVMRPFTFLLAGICLLCACSQYGDESSAAERAERLNAAKAQARELVDGARYDDAVAVLEPLSEEASGDHQVFVMLGEAYKGVGRNQDAIGAYETAMRLNYNDQYAHLKLANLLMEMGKTGRALTEFELAAKFGDFDAVTHYDFGLALHQMGRYDRALAEWQTAYQLESNNPRYAEAVGIGLSRTRPKDAVPYFQEARQLGADEASFYNNYALALQSAGERRLAAAQFGNAVERAPENEDYRFNLAAAYTNMGAFREAIAQWDTLRARFGFRWSYTVYRGKALLERARYDEAIASVEAIVAEYESGALARDGDRLDRTPPRLGEALEILAMSHRGAGDSERALEYIQRAVELEPTNVSFLNNYGVILAEGGSIDQAKSQWRKVLEIDAGNAAAMKNLSAVEP